MKDFLKENYQQTFFVLLVPYVGSQYLLPFSKKTSKETEMTKKDIILANHHKFFSIHFENLWCEISLVESFLMG